MSELTRLTEDLNIISSLPDEPDSEEGYTPEVLKEKFDSSVNITKTYINDTLIPELETNFKSIEKNISEDCATKKELEEVQAGLIIDGTITYPKLSEDVQNKIEEAEKVKPIYKYHKLDNPVITKEDGKYINNFSLDVLPENLVDGFKFSVEFPNADEKQNGTDYYTSDGYKISATNIQDYEHSVDKAFDGNIDTNCILTASDTIILTLPEAKTFTKIKTFITADNLENIIYKGSNDKETWTNLGIVSTADIELTEHEFTISGEYLYYGIEINVTEGNVTINDIQFEEDENIPSNWILGTGVGMLTGDVIENRINGIEILDNISPFLAEDFCVKDNKITILNNITRYNTAMRYNKVSKIVRTEIDEYVPSTEISTGKLITPEDYINNIIQVTSSGTDYFTDPSLLFDDDTTTYYDVGTTDENKISSSNPAWVEIIFDRPIYKEITTSFTTVSSNQNQYVTGKTITSIPHEKYENAIKGIKLNITAISSSTLSYGRVGTLNVKSWQELEKAHHCNYVVENISNKFVDNQIFKIEVPEKILDFYKITQNSINGIEIDTLLQPDKYYELVYKGTDNKFYAKEVRV